MRLEPENVLVGSPLGGLVVCITIFLTYGLPSMLFVEAPFEVITRFGSVDSREINRAMNAQMAGYLFGKSVFPWLSVSLAGGAVFTLLYGLNSLLLKQGSSIVWGALIYGCLSMVISSPTMFVFLKTHDILFLFSWMGFSFGIAGSFVVFMRYADPNTPDPYENVPKHKKLGREDAPDWAKEAARRIADNNGG